VAAIDANAGKAERKRLGAQALDLGAGGFGFQGCVVDIGSKRFWAQDSSPQQLTDGCRHRNLVSMFSC
jgi:predicted rRNA methylase YqxC with S4 and FtsJ domains